MSAAAKRRAEARQKRRTLWRPLDRVLPKAAKTLIPESALLSQLMEMERKMDVVLERKRIEVQDAIRRPLKTWRRLRIFLSFCTLRPEMGAEEHAAAASSQIRWGLRIEGRLLDEEGTRPVPCRRLTANFKRLLVLTDTDVIIEWNRSATSEDADGFEVTRQCAMDKLPTKIHVFLWLDHQPEKFVLAPALGDLLGMHSGTRASIVAATWDYVRSKKLLDGEERDVINSDPSLQRLLGEKKVPLSQLPTRLERCFLPARPIELEMAVAPTETEPVDLGVFDVEIEVEDSLASTAASSFLLSTDAQRELREIDEEIKNAVAALETAREQRNFMLAFAEDPQQFVLQWLASQAADEKVVEKGPGPQQLARRTEHFQGSWARDAVYAYLKAQTEERRLKLMQEQPNVAAAAAHAVGASTSATS